MEFIKQFLADDQACFRYDKAEIARRNRRMLVDGCFVYAAVLLFYTVFTSLTGHATLLSRMYYVFDGAHLLLCGIVFLLRKKTGYPTTQHLCFALEFLLLAFFVLEAVYTSPAEHSLYVPIAIILVLLLFTHRAAYTLSLTGAYIVSFALLSCLYKTPHASANDLQIAAATLISSIIGYGLIARLRHQESAALRQSERLRRYDGLTGLLNKEAMETGCEELLARCELSCAMVIFDLDQFKSVNDRFGHAVGDEVLAAVGQVLGEGFPETELVGRFGGDEFWVMVKPCFDADALYAQAEAARRQIAALRFSAPELTVTGSAGFALRRPEEDFASLFHRADQALYQAKASGKSKTAQLR